MITIPSFSQIARGITDAMYPSLREGMIGAWYPSIGVQPGKLRDLSGNNRHAAATGAPTWSAFGADCPSNNIYWNTGYVLDRSNPFSILFFGDQIANVVGDNTYIGQQDGTSLGIVRDITQEWSFGSADIDSAGSVGSLTGRVFTGATYDGTTQAITVMNKGAMFTGTSASTFTTSTNTIILGNYGSNAYQNWAWPIGGIVLYKRKLASSEILRFFCDPFAPIRRLSQRIAVPAVAGSLLLLRRRAAPGAGSMNIATGSTSQSINIAIVDDSGKEVTGLVADTVTATVQYSLAGITASTTITLSDLSAITSAYSSGGIKERASGIYRLDVPNAALASAGTVIIYGATTGQHILCEPIIVGNVPTSVNAVNGTAFTGTNVPANVLTTGGVAINTPGGVFTQQILAVGTITANVLAGAATISTNYTASGTTVLAGCKLVVIGYSTCQPVINTITVGANSTFTLLTAPTQPITAGAQFVVMTTDAVNVAQIQNDSNSPAAWIIIVDDYVDPDTGGILPSVFNGNVPVSVLDINGDTTAAAKLALQYNGTGIVGPTYPAQQQQVFGIGATSAPNNAVATGFTLTTGSQTGTYANTYYADASYHQLTNAAGVIDGYYTGSVGANTIPVTVHIDGYASGVGTVLIEAWDYNTSAWGQIGTMTGSTSTVNQSFDFDLNSTNFDASGNWQTRIYSASLTGGSVYIDRFLEGYSWKPVTVANLPTGFQATAFSSTVGTSTLTQAQVTGGSYPLEADGSGYMKISSGTGTGQLNISGGNLAGAVPSVAGAVGSVTGNVGGNVSGTVTLAASQPNYAPATSAALSTLSTLVSSLPSASAIAQAVGSLSSLSGFSSGTAAYQWSLLGTNAGDSPNQQTAQGTLVSMVIGEIGLTLTPPYDAAKIAASQDSVNALPTATQIANDLLDLADAVETGITMRQALRGYAAVLLGTTGGANTEVETFNAAGGTTTRVTSTNDGNDNRTAITLNL